jgi:hypothetical protein
MKRETASARLYIFFAIDSGAADTDAPLTSTNSVVSEGQPAERTATGPRPAGAAVRNVKS